MFLYPIRLLIICFSLTVNGICKSSYSYIYIRDIRSVNNIRNVPISSSTSLVSASFCLYFTSRLVCRPIEESNVLKLQRVQILSTRALSIII